MHKSKPMLLSMSKNEKSIEEKFGERLRALRKECGLTQEKLAEIAGLEYKYIQMLEGKKPPSPTLRTQNKLAKALKTTIMNLVDFSKES